MVAVAEVLVPNVDESIMVTWSFCDVRRGCAVHEGNNNSISFTLYQRGTLQVDIMTVLKMENTVDNTQNTLKTYNIFKFKALEKYLIQKDFPKIKMTVAMRKKLSRHFLILHEQFKISPKSTWSTHIHFQLTTHYLHRQQMLCISPTQSWYILILRH